MTDPQEKKAVHREISLILEMGRQAMFDGALSERTFVAFRNALQEVGEPQHKLLYARVFKHMLFHVIKLDEHYDGQAFRNTKAPLIYHGR